MNSIIKKIGKEPGQTVAVMAGVHGNERAGVEALASAIKTIRIKSGVVYFIYANPEAIAKRVRFISKNLNRCFSKENIGTTLEDARARELMKIFDQCDALLDLHASNSRRTIPFIICEQEASALARKMAFPIVSSGWDRLEGGAADGYMHRQHKPALCLECGSVYDADNNRRLAENSIYQFLYYFGLIDQVIPYSSQRQRRINVYNIACKRTAALSFSREFSDFEQLEMGKIFARDGEIEYRGAEGDCIIFPRPNGPLGSEAFILGKEFKNK